MALPKTGSVLQAGGSDAAGQRQHQANVAVALIVKAFIWIVRAHKNEKIKECISTSKRINSNRDIRDVNMVSFGISAQAVLRSYIAVPAALTLRSPRYNYAIRQ
jgi:ribosomal protein L34E